MLRKIMIFSLIFLVTVSFPFDSSAHSGRTDSSGGHNCSQKSINKGLCSGYHYHNGGSSSGGGNSSSGTVSQPAPKPKPVDENQIKANDYLKKANDYFNDGDYKNAISMIEEIERLNKSNSASDKLLSKSHSKILSDGDKFLKEKGYHAAKTEYNFLINNVSTPKDIKDKANVKLTEVDKLINYQNYFEKSKNDFENKNYMEAINNVKNSIEINKTKEALELYENSVTGLNSKIFEDYEKYKLSDVQNSIQFMQQLNHKNYTPIKYEPLSKQIHIENSLFGKFKIKTVNRNEKNLFNQTNNLDITYKNKKDNVVNFIKKTLNNEETEKMINDINMKEIVKEDVISDAK